LSRSDEGEMAKTRRSVEDAEYGDVETRDVANRMLSQEIQGCSNPKDLETTKTPDEKRIGGTLVTGGKSGWKTASRGKAKGAA